MWSVGVLLFEMFAGHWIVQNVLDGAVADDGDDVAMTFGDGSSESYSLSTSEMRAVNAIAALHDEAREAR